MQDRPFANVNEMNYSLIANINARVRNNDILYILGDNACRCPLEKANNFISMINGRKILLRGNHDKNYDKSLFEEILDFHELVYNAQSIFIMHYPM